MSRLAKRTWDDTGAMSIHDRDWLREATLRPPSNDSTFTTWLIVAATAVVWAMRHFNLSLPHSDPKVAFEPTSLRLASKSRSLRRLTVGRRLPVSTGHLPLRRRWPRRVRRPNELQRQPQHHLSSGADRRRPSRPDRLPAGDAGRRRRADRPRRRGSGHRDGEHAHRSGFKPPGVHGLGRRDSSHRRPDASATVEL